MPTPKVGRVFQQMKPRRTKRQTKALDLIFEKGVPIAVFEWRDGPNGREASVGVQLDPNKLHPTIRNKDRELDDYVYEEPIIDPRL